MTEEKPQVEVTEVKQEIVKHEGPPVLLARQAEIESAIATAKQYPRDVVLFRKKLKQMATLDGETAKACIYTLPREGHPSGPSVRFAEIALTCYGNVIASADIIGEDEGWVYAEGMCRDLENNVAFRCKVRRRITKSDGRRYGADMIGVTGMAACAVAARNSIFKVIPAAYLKVALDAAKELAVGKGKDFAANREDVLKRLEKLGISRRRVLSAVDRQTEKDITPDDLLHIIGLGTAISQHEIAAEKAFPYVTKEAEKGKADTEKPKRRGRGKAKTKKSDEPKPDDKGSESEPEQEQVQTKPVEIPPENDDKTTGYLWD